MKQNKNDYLGWRQYYYFIIFVLTAYCPIVTIIGQTAKPVKICSSFYTDNKIRNATDNIRRYSWAKKEKEKTVRRAERWLDYYHNDVGLLWDLVPSQNIPRSYAVNSSEGCLVCRKAIDKYGNYSYLYDESKIDWKLTCPNCQLTFPTNNFKAYYESGLDGHGNFIPEKAKAHNDSLIRAGQKGNLINLYSIQGLNAEQLKHLKETGIPDSLIHRITTDPFWGVDNAMGYRFNINDKQKYGSPYTYVAYYAHWALWYKRLMPMLQDLSYAYMFTRYSDDKNERAKSQTFADAAIVLLDRIADLYPTLYVSTFPRNGYFGFPNNGFKWHTNISAGRIVGSIWENELVKDIMFAYDAVFPAIERLSDKTKQILAQRSGLPNKGYSNNIKSNFENGILREIPKAFSDGDLQGNPGMQQSSLALAAVLMNHYPETLQWLNTVFRNGHSDWEGTGKRDGGSIMHYLVNKISRDGQGDEISIAYNAGWLANWLVVAKILDGYHLPNNIKLEGGIQADIFGIPRFRMLMKSNYPYLLTDRFVPHIGDTSLTGMPGFKGNPDYDILNIDNLILAYHKYQDKEMAQAIYTLKNQNLKDIHLDIFSKNPENIQNTIRKTIQKDGLLKLPSHNFTAYGLGILRDGLSTTKEKAFTQRALWLFYGTRSASHNHADPLNLGYIGYYLDLMPDFGYPNTLGGDLNPEQQWDKSTPAHNTVSFDNLNYNGHIVGYGKPLHFDDSKIVKLIDASSDSVQNGNVCRAKHYRRTTGLIRIDKDDSYIVDFFRVDSPLSYTYNFHTAEIDSTATQYRGLTFLPAKPITYNTKTLYDVRSASVAGKKFSIDWNAVDTWNCYGKGKRTKTDVHVKLTMIGDNSNIQIGKAVPPTNNKDNPHWLPILRVPGKGEKTYASIIEPYLKTSKILSVDTASVTVGGIAANNQSIKALKVKLANGRTDYIVNATDNNNYFIDNHFYFCGFFGFISIDKDGKIIHKYINDGSLLNGKKYIDRIKGTIIDATSNLSEHNYITIKTDCPVNKLLLKGKYIYIDNKDIGEKPNLMKYNAVYPIKDAVRLTNNTYRLNLDDISVIRGWKDLNNYHEGYLRDFNIGSIFFIPLSYSE